MAWTSTVTACGVAPLGLFACGLSTETVTETDDGQTGSRFLDPRTGDYATQDGVILRAGSARQRVILILTTEVKTSMAIKGIRFPAKHDATTARTVQADVRRALQPLVDDGSIILTDVQAQTQSEGVNGRLGISVAYIDQQTGEPDALEL